MTSAPPGVAAQDWLAYRWAVSIDVRWLAGTATFFVMAGGCEVHHCGTREAAERWVATARPSSLADMITDWAGASAAIALIEGGREGRLARIPARLWPSYDAMRVNATDAQLTLLSAKARAMFPAARAVFIRVRPG
ncbi:MAG: hypothetical protein V4475_01975 [Pseudomonadota bacterium]